MGEHEGRSVGSGSLVRVHDADTARAFLRAWGSRIPRGILLSALEGATLCASVSMEDRYSDKERKGYHDARSVLRDAARVRGWT
mgnify:CR=1 FL=1